MKLNEMCMKDILQYCADDLQITKSGKAFTLIRLMHIPKHFSSRYNEEDIIYSVRKLIELNYIVISEPSDFDNGWQPSTFIRDVTYEGHKYLEKFMAD